MSESTGEMLPTGVNVKAESGLLYKRMSDMSLEDWNGKFVRELGEEQNFGWSRLTARGVKQLESIDDPVELSGLVRAITGEIDESKRDMLSHPAKSDSDTEAEGRERELKRAYESWSASRRELAGLTAAVALSGRAELYPEGLRALAGVRLRAAEPEKVPSGLVEPWLAVLEQVDFDQDGGWEWLADAPDSDGLFDLLSASATKALKAKVAEVESASKLSLPVEKFAWQVRQAGLAQERVAETRRQQERAERLDRARADAVVDAAGFGRQTVFDTYDRGSGWNKRLVLSNNTPGFGSGVMHEWLRDELPDGASPLERAAARLRQIMHREQAGPIPEALSRIKTDWMGETRVDWKRQTEAEKQKWTEVIDEMSRYGAAGMAVGLVTRLAEGGRSLGESMLQKWDERGAAGANAGGTGAEADDWDRVLKARDFDINFDTEMDEMWAEFELIGVLKALFPNGGAAEFVNDGVWPDDLPERTKDAAQRAGELFLVWKQRMEAQGRGDGVRKLSTAAAAADQKKRSF